MVAVRLPQYGGDREGDIRYVVSTSGVENNFPHLAEIRLRGSLSLEFQSAVGRFLQLEQPQIESLRDRENDSICKVLIFKTR